MFHVSKKDKVWHVHKKGEEKNLQDFKTQDEAVAFARDLAIKEKCSVFVHGEDGQIREVWNYKKNWHKEK